MRARQGLAGGDGDGDALRVLEPGVGLHLRGRTTHGDTSVVRRRARPWLEGGSSGHLIVRMLEVDLGARVVWVVGREGAQARRVGRKEKHVLTCPELEAPRQPPP